MNIFGLNIQRRESAEAAKDACEKKEKLGANFTAEPVYVHGEQGALSVSPWYRAMEVLANSVGQAVMEFQRVRPGHANTYEKYMYGYGKEMNYLLGVQVNPMMTSMEFLKQMTLQRGNNGAGVAYVEREAGDVKNIWLCSAAARDFVADAYYVSYNRPGVGVVSLKAKPEDIIYWPNTFSRDGGVTGVGNLSYAIGALSTAATNEKQARDMAAKGGKFKILLSEDQSNTDSMFNLLSKEQRMEARKQLQEQISGNYDVMEVAGLVKAQIISQDANQMNLLQSRIHDSTVVAQFTGVPLPMLMINTNNTYKAPEQLRQQFYQDTVAPMLKSFEMAVQRTLVPKEQAHVFRCHFNTDELMRLDPKGQMELFKMQLETGVLCVNEVRERLNMPAIEGGDQHLVSTNLQKIDEIKVGKNQASNEA